MQTITKKTRLESFINYPKSFKSSYAKLMMIIITNRVNCFSLCLSSSLNWTSCRYTSLGISVTIAVVVGLLIFIFVIPHHRAKILDVILPRATEMELKRTDAEAQNPKLKGLKMNSSQLPITPNVSTVLPTTVDQNYTPIMMPGEIKPKTLVYSPNEKVTTNELW